MAMMALKMTDRGDRSRKDEGGGGDQGSGGLTRCSNLVLRGKPRTAKRWWKQEEKVSIELLSVKAPKSVTNFK